MSNIYGVVFKDGGKLYYFKSDDIFCPINVTVIVETEQGLQFGKVINHYRPEDIEIDIEKIKNILRISTKKDYEVHLKNLKDAKEALEYAKEVNKDLGLKMSFIDSSFNFDRKQLLLNFVAEDRVDFRELAKKLAAKYKTRIELRQVGARDKAKEVKGIGICGRELCCSCFLREIDSISMSMAKNQNLALNPAKINGVCGRLLCCLTYENDNYTECRKCLPNVGDKVKHDDKIGEVISVDILNKKYKLNIDGEIVEVDGRNECRKK